MPAATAYQAGVSVGATGEDFFGRHGTPEAGFSLPVAHTKVDTFMNFVPSLPHSAQVPVGPSSGLGASHHPLQQVSPQAVSGGPSSVGSLHGEPKAVGNGPYGQFSYEAHFHGAVLSRSCHSAGPGPSQARMVQLYQTDAVPSASSFLGRPAPPLPASGAAPKPKMANLTRPRRKPASHACFYPNCGKTYTKSSHLKAHLRTHTGKEGSGLQNYTNTEPKGTSGVI